MTLKDFIAIGAVAMTVSLFIFFITNKVEASENIGTQCYSYAIENSETLDIGTCVHWKIVFKEHGIDLPTGLAYKMPVVEDSIYAGQS